MADSMDNSPMTEQAIGSSQSLILSLPNAEATHQLGVALGQSLSAGSVLLLEGNLGSGKTTLVQGIGKGLGITEPIASPTFILLNEYPEGRVPLYHFDLYRLDPSEVNSLYLEGYWEGSEYVPGIVAIEWADRLPHRPPNYLTIQLTYTPSGDRQAQLIPVGRFCLDIRLEGLRSED